MDPASEYKQRLEARRQVEQRYKRLHIRLGNARLAVVVVGVAACWLVFAGHSLPAWSLLFPAVGFVALVVVHERVQRRRRRAHRAARFYERGVERLEGRWSGKGDCGERFADDQHPYALDLDLFGRGSLFEMMCTARTLAGQRTLAYWLLHPAEPEEIRERQEAVEELRDRLELREELALLGEEVRRGVHAGALPRWGEAPPLLDSTAGRMGAAALAAVSAGTFVGWILHGLPAAAFLAGVVAAEGALGLWYRRRVLEVMGEVEHPSHDLAVLSEVLRRLEQEPFSCARLRRLQKALETGGQTPSRRIRRLKRLIELLDSRDHLVMRAVGPLLLWSTQLCFAVEAWRKKTGPQVRRWLRAVGEFEALSALAGYAYEHPSDPFAELVEGCACFEGEGLGHPLIPESQCVRNDVRLDSERQLLVVSGSNMSGKSTLLRTVGTNAVLAMAGAPVRARRLRLSPLRVGAAIRVTDSLQSGMSRFYSEITRIRRLMELAEEKNGKPLLFLLDELLHGTNSHDRKVGAEAIVRGLVERGAMGLVTTHDLALAHIAERLAPKAANVHFQDRLEKGRMTFDYILRPGVVEHSNAIELMRSVGLEV